MPSSMTMLAPELAASQWFNTPAPLTIRALRGRPVLLHTFQLLCPGCAAEAIPQVRRIERVFAETDLQVIGLHTVFEHHAAMTPVTLGAFLHEYRITHPIAVDQPSEHSPVPITMQAYGFRGTPSSVLIGRNGAILHQAFGIEDPIAVGARIAMALSTRIPAAVEEDPADDANGCESGRCEVPAPSSAAA